MSVHGPQVQFSADTCPQGDSNVGLGCVRDNVPFRQGPRQTQRKPFEELDIKAEAFEKLMEYIYTDELKSGLDQHNVYDVIHAGEKSHIRLVENIVYFRS